MSKFDELNKAITHLMKARDIFSELLEKDKSNPMPPNEACVFYDEFKTAYTTATDQTKALTKLLQYMSYTWLPEKFASNDIKTITVDSVNKRFTISHKTNVRQVADKPTIMEWLRKNEAEALIQETVNASSLASFAKYRLEEEGKDLPPELFEVTVARLVSATKVKS